MCQSVPYIVLEVQGSWALVKGTVPELRTERSEGIGSRLPPHGFNHTHRVYLGLLKGVEPGDFLLVHGDMAINRIEKDDAETVLRLTCA